MAIKRFESDIIINGAISIKGGGLSQFLKADGSLDGNSYEISFGKNNAFNKNFGTSAGTVAQGNDVRINNGQTAFGWGNHVGQYLPLSGGNLSGKITFNTNNIDNGFLWNVNSDQAGITFKNSGDGDANSNLNFFTKDNGNEYFKFSHTTWNAGALDYLDIKNRSVRANGELYANALQSGDVALGTNALVGGSLVWHAGNFVAGTESVNYAVGNDSRINNGQTAFESLPSYLPLIGGTITGDFRVNGNTTLNGARNNIYSTVATNIGSPTGSFQGGLINYASAPGVDFDITYTRTSQAVWKHKFVNQTMEWRNNANLIVFHGNNAGEVGIGVVPQSGFKLDVAGSTVTRGDVYLSGTLRYFGIGDFNLATGGVRDLVITTNNEKVRIKGDTGNVGIGTNTPSEKLEVIGKVKFGTGTTDTSSFGGMATIVTPANTQNSLFLLQAGVGSAHIGFKPNDSKLYFVNSYSSGLISDSTSMVLDTLGNVGIGTNNPSRLLSVNGVFGVQFNSTTELFYINPTSTGADFSLKNVGGGTEFRVDTRTGQKVAYYTGGNFGIGTTTPSEKLEVLSTLATGSWLKINPSAPGRESGIKIRQSTTYGADIYFNDAVGTDKGIKIDYVNVDTRYNALFITPSTNPSVGLGTYTPTEKLEVVGNVKATNFYGNLVGNVIGTSSKVVVSNHISNNIEYNPVWENTAGTLYYSSDKYKYNPSLGRLTATTFKGALNGNADTATNIAWSGVTSTPTTLSGYGITDAYTKTQIDTSLLTSSRNLIANNAYSSSVVGYQYTSGRNLVTGQNNRINLSKGAAANSYNVKTPGYYSVSFWYMVSSFVSSGANVVQVNDVSFATISITGNVAWTFYSGTIYVNGYINGLGFFDMEQTGNSLITVSDIVLTRSSQPSQQYYPAPEDYQTPQTTLSGYGITDAYTQTTANAKFVDFTTAQSITGLKIFSNGLIDNVTNIGKTVTPYTVIPTGGWAKAVGTSIFSQSTSVGGPGIVGYWATLGRRDFAGGYSGIYSGYNGADSYLGSAGDGANNPIWQKILTEANFISGAGSTNYASGDDQRILNGQSAFTSLASYLPLSGGLMSGTIARSTSVAGYQVGSYNIATNDLKSNPIYTIGTSYIPSDTTLGNMFGIGYTHASASFINSTDLGATPSAWGQYVAAGGKAKIFFEANNGNIYAKNNIYAQDGVFRGNISALGGTSTGWNSAFNWGNHAAAGYYSTALISAAKAYSNVSTFTVPASMPESWIRVYSGGGLKLLSLHISCNYDNTSSIEEIKATVSGWGMFHHLKSTTSDYNASRLLEVKTTDLQNGIAEIWIRIGASTAAGTVRVSSSESIPTLVIATPVFSGSNAVSLVYTNRRTNSMLITRGIEIDGNKVLHDGNTSPNDLLGLATFTKSIQLTKDWQDAGIGGTDLATGTFAVSIECNDYPVGGNFSMGYSGMAYIYSGGTNDSNAHEIVLHGSGHASLDKALFVRVKLNPAGRIAIQISANYATTGVSNYTFKFRKLI